MYLAFLYYTAVARDSYEALFFFLIDDDSDSDDQVEDGES